MKLQWNAYEDKITIFCVSGTFCKVVFLVRATATSNMLSYSEFFHGATDRKYGTFPVRYIALDMAWWEPKGEFCPGEGSIRIQTVSLMSSIAYSLCQIDDYIDSESE